MKKLLLVLSLTLLASTANANEHYINVLAKGGKVVGYSTEIKQMGTNHWVLIQVGTQLYTCNLTIGARCTVAQ